VFSALARGAPAALAMFARIAGKSTPSDANHCMHAAGGGADPCSLL
jgi:hypothetical protein